MDRNTKYALVVTLIVIGLFAILVTNPVKRQSNLQGRIVIQQPSSQFPSSYEDDIINIQSSTSQKSILRNDINLADWKTTEIAKGIAKYNTRLDPIPYDYKYHEDECTYYSLYGEIFGSDPFCSLVYAWQGEEWDDGHLRIYHLNYDIKESADVKYQEYLDKVVRATQLDPQLICYSEKECRNVDVIVCTKGTNNYFSWFEGNILMTSVNDARRNLDAFTKFYCQTELKSLTGNIVSGIDDELIINKIASFLRRLS